MLREIRTVSDLQVDKDMAVTRMDGGSRNREAPLSVE